MIMFEQSRRLSEPLRWGRREKTVVAVLLSCCALAVLALVAFGLTSGARARRDCIGVTFASTLGAAQVNACGQRARTICASPGGLRTIGPELRAACERARMPFATH